VSQWTPDFIGIQESNPLDDLEAGIKKAFKEPKEYFPRYIPCPFSTTTIRDMSANAFNEMIFTHMIVNPDQYRAIQDRKIEIEPIT